MPAGERCRRAVCGRTACTVRCGGGRRPNASRHCRTALAASRRPYRSRSSASLARVLLGRERLRRRSRRATRELERRRSKMKFYFVPRPEPLIRSKRLEMALVTQRGRCAARRSGQRPGQRSGGGRLSQPLAQRENPRHDRGSPMELAGLEPAASWVRFGRPLRANSRIVAICRAFSEPRFATGHSLLRTFAGDSRELRPENQRCGLNVRRTSMRFVLSDPLVANQRSARPRKSPLRPLPFAQGGSAVSGATGLRRTRINRRAAMPTGRRGWRSRRSRSRHERPQDVAGDR